MTYSAPVQDMRFVMRELAGLDHVAALPGCEGATPDVVDAVLEEAGKFAAGVLAPLNAIGDRQGARWADGAVTTAPGWKDAYSQFVAGGWPSLGFEPDIGGQGLPKLVSAAVFEMWKSANLAFSLCPMLTSGAIEALVLRGTDKQKATFLPKLVAGEWAGTMNLTEPQAGSDLAAVRTRAVPQDDGTYRIFGQKIFITYGEHDLTDNIVHLVLARLPDAPAGAKGISLFVVPKFLISADGSLGVRNDVRCVSIEHKLGIHASPTCVLAFGDNGGAVGELLGAPHRGLEAMFIMMNAARFGVGLEGLAVAERAYQAALAYAKQRMQGTDASGERVAIIRHPDVRRMLMLMKSQVEAMRALAYVVAAAGDEARHGPDEAARKSAQAFFELMTPVVKGWNTENAIEIASTGIQVHGGMGYIEETGAAQYLRDARITAIYEGTTGIQANDLVGRKVARDGGAAIGGVIRRMRDLDAELAKQADDDFGAIRAGLAGGVQALQDATAHVLARARDDASAVAAGAVPFLRLMGIVSGGWQSARGALAAKKRLVEGSNDGFHRAKIATARFYADHVLAQAPALLHTIMRGSAGTLALAEDQF
jgi:acyl-CoA dehydrogenase